MVAGTWHKILVTADLVLGTERWYERSVRFKLVTYTVEMPRSWTVGPNMSIPSKLEKSREFGSRTDVRGTSGEMCPPPGLSRRQKQLLTFCCAQQIIGTCFWVR